MMTLSKPLSAGQAKKYYEAEYTNARESYYTEDDHIDGEWFGKLAKEWKLEGAVNKEAFARLTEGQDPHTGEQLIRHVNAKEYENQYGEKVTNSEHRAGYDATFSAPKSVSLAALVGDDERIRDLAIGLWMEVDPTPHGRASPVVIEIQKRLLIYLTNKLNDNLDKGYYPMVVRVLIMLIGIWDSKDKDPATLGFATRELHEQLRKKYAAAYASDHEKAGRMLPAWVTFESSTNELVSVNKYAKTTSRLSVVPP